MGLLDKAFDFLTGGIGSKLADKLIGLLPDNMTEAEKKDFALKSQAIAHAQDLELQKLALENEKEFNQRIKDLEGTANDLKTIPVIGAFVIFLRGAFRPLFAYFTAICIYLSFSQTWILSEKQENMLWVMIILALGFYFGERSLKNVMPIINNFLEKKGILKNENGTK